MNLSVRFLNAKHMKHVLARGVACSTLLVLPSCHIPPLHQAEPGPGVPAGFNTPNSSGANSSENSAQLGIEEFYTDPMLTRLIQQALVSNRELKILDQEVQIARNEILARQGAYLPFVGFGAGGGLTQYSTYTLDGASRTNDPYLPGKYFPNPNPNTQVGLNLTWQLDIWRALRTAREAAQQRYIAASEKRNFFVTRLVADVAENYYRLVALDKRIENLNSIIELQEQSLKVAQTKMEQARGTALPVQRFQAEVRKNQSEKLIVQQEIIETSNRINFLVNRFPEPVERMSAGFYDLNIHALSVGVPAQLLQNRPDIRQAERELEAAGLDVKVARSHFFPVLTLTGGVGFEAFNPMYLFTNPAQALIANVAGGLVAPLVNKKAIQAEYLTANARQLQSVYDYQRIILDAFTEVVNRMSMVENYSRSIEIRKQQVQSLEASVDSATKLVQNAQPGVDYIDVLFAQRDLMDARMDLIETKKQQLTAVVRAYQALGGGSAMFPIATGKPPQPHP